MDEVLTGDRRDVANPGCEPGAVAAAARRDPADLAPAGGSLLRFGWASAALEAHPELHEPWASTTDRAVRRALMRSPTLPEHVAELLVATRRAGMHTLGANPVTPIHLLRDNPAARRRRAAVDEVLGGGLEAVAADPNRWDLAALGSGTVDLVVARATLLTSSGAERLACRVDPPCDPWVLSVVVERFGEPIWDAAASTASPGRRRAVRRLSPRAAVIG